MAVVSGVIATKAKFSDKDGIEKIKSMVSVETIQTISDPKNCPPASETSLTIQNLFHLLIDGVSMNSTAFQGKDPQGNPILLGSKTECAFLDFLEKLGFKKFQQLRDDSNKAIVQVYPFSSEMKRMSIVMKRICSDGSVVYRVHSKGASEIILEHCKNVLVQEGEGIKRYALDAAYKTQMLKVIGNHPRIAFYRNF